MKQSFFCHREESFPNGKDDVAISARGKGAVQRLPRFARNDGQEYNPAHSELVEE